jgi:hypothetical protein
LRLGLGVGLLGGEEQERGEEGEKEGTHHPATLKMKG